MVKTDYVEKDLQREVNRWGTPLSQICCQEGCSPCSKSCRHPKQLREVYAGPAGCEYWHLDNDPWAPGKTRFTKPKPYDCRLTMRCDGIGQVHAIELKVSKGGTFALSSVQDHQWKGLQRLDACGSNCYGWVLICWARALERVLMAHRVTVLADWHQRHPSITRDWSLANGLRLLPVICHPWKTSLDDQFGWDLSKLRQPTTRP